MSERFIKIKNYTININEVRYLYFYDLIDRDKRNHILYKTNTLEIGFKDGQHRALSKCSKKDAESLANHLLTLNQYIIKMEKFAVDVSNVKIINYELEKNRMAIHYKDNPVTFIECNKNQFEEFCEKWSQISK